MCLGVSLFAIINENSLNKTEPISSVRPIPENARKHYSEANLANQRNFLVGVLETLRNLRSRLYFKYVEGRKGSYILFSLSSSSIPVDQIFVRVSKHDKMWNQILWNDRNTIRVIQILMSLVSSGSNKKKEKQKEKAEHGVILGHANHSTIDLSQTIPQTCLPFIQLDAVNLELNISASNNKPVYVIVCGMHYLNLLRESKRQIRIRLF
ncbi:hypothetical protein BLOT_015201 [Blomia tropicalis]|nr:hypothetical protein BLOT_015201 [Blomia tropicalis]